MVYFASDGAVEELSTDEVAIIFSFLTHVDIMHARVCSTWSEAAKKAAPLSIFYTHSTRSYNAMRALSTALPNLQKMSLLKGRHTYSNGEDPDRSRGAYGTALDVNIISNFRKLREMSICEAPLNGRYPVLFDFPLLRVLRIYECRHLKFDLEMLEGLPSLKELYCAHTPHLNGSVNSLRVLRDSLERVEIFGSPNITGNFMDLADFPRLRELDLIDTGVTGVIRDISGSDFPALARINLPNTVAGGPGYEFRRIEVVPSFMHAIHLLMQRKIIPHDWTLTLSQAFHWRLSRDSPEWYAPDPGDDNPILLEARLIGVYLPDPPFSLQIIQAGKRLGWSWCTQDRDHSCEINWLDPVPSESDDYETYR